MGDDATPNTTTRNSEPKLKQEQEDPPSTAPAKDNTKEKTTQNDEDSRCGGENDDEEEKSDDEDDETKKKREAELKEKYKDWPLRGIKEPHENDVMYGRGGGTNHHPGNKRYRKMVEDRKLEYVNSKRLDKPLVALEIIRVWRAQLPPGRFLKLDEKTGLWNDVGDKKAREKTSQALREKAPMIRKQQEEETVDEEEKEEDVKTTRFAEGTKKEDANQVKKAVLARDHSLGREYIEAGEAVTLEGFSWQDPFQSKPREASYVRPVVPPTAYPAGRNSSHGSLGMAPPHHVTSVGAPPPPPDYWGRVNSNERQREFSSGRYESWGSTPYGYPAPLPPHHGHGMHQRSGSWTHESPPLPGRHVHHRSGSWGSEREHSLGVYPLIGASVAGPADRGTFDSGRSTSGLWGDATTMGSSARGILPPSPPPPPPVYGGGPMRSSGSLGPYRQPISPTNSTPSPKPYSVDLSIAKTWSGGEVQRTWSGEHEPPVQQVRPYDEILMPGFRADFGPASGSDNYVPKPQIVKRDTSHQNENYETKHSVKRAALNRDNSLASNRLKHEYMPEFFKKKFDEEQEMRSLSSNLEQSTLNTQRPKPQPLTQNERVSTFDVIAFDLIAKPAPMLKDDRVSTIDALDLDLDDVPENKTEESLTPLEDLPKPKSLDLMDRLTTNDFMSLVVDEGASTDDLDNPLPLNQERIADDWLTQV